MNEFEIKAVKLGLEGLSIVEIYTISKQYNEEQYGGHEVDNVIEYTYRGINFLTFIVFEEMINGRRVKVKTDALVKVTRAITRAKDVVDGVVYCEESETNKGYTFEGFVATQIDLFHAKEDLGAPSANFNEIDPLWDRIAQGKGTQNNNLQLFLDCMEIGKKEWV